MVLVVDFCLAIEFMLPSFVTVVTRQLDKQKNAIEFVDVSAVYVRLTCGKKGDGVSLDAERFVIQQCVRKLSFFECDCPIKEKHTILVLSSAAEYTGQRRSFGF